jgi:hypothetical protein
MQRQSSIHDTKLCPFCPRGMKFLCEKERKDLTTAESPDGVMHRALVTCVVDLMRDVEAVALICGEQSTAQKLRLAIHARRAELAAVLLAHPMNRQQVIGQSEGGGEREACV